MSLPIIEIPRVCCTCSHWWFSQGEDAWSEVTPGSDASMGCSKNVWDFDFKENGEGEYREVMLAALKCAHYEVAKLETK